MKRVLFLLFTLLSLTSFGAVVWFDGQHPITYQMPRKVEPVVKIALEMWKGDMQQVTGMEPVASSKAVVKVVQASSLPADGFRIYIKGGQIIIEGSNGRGMAYGLLELSRMAGVSPWVWWGDVVPEKKTACATGAIPLSIQHPSDILDRRHIRRYSSCYYVCGPMPSGLLCILAQRLSSKSPGQRQWPIVVVSSSELRIASLC